MPVRTTTERDYYRILEVPAGASEEEIRKAYRRLAFQLHPDRNPGNPRATEQFKQISEAYAVLIDPTKRRQYDLARQGTGAWEFRYSQEDLFRDLFANPRASNIFEELAREFERMGMRVDRRYFRDTLFGGRTVITGGIFIISPFTPVAALFKMARAALRGAPAAGASSTQQHQSLPGPSDIIHGIGRFTRWLFGVPERSSTSSSPAKKTSAESRHTIPLHLTEQEAKKGGPQKVTVDGDNGVRDLLVTIPPGVRTGTVLRLRNKGHIDKDGFRGDHYLNVEVGSQS